MDELACRRPPIFHSEADFQHELAWLLRKETHIKPRLEYPYPPKPRKDKKDTKGENAKIRKREYMDIWLPGKDVAIELKYQTNELGSSLSGESFQLTQQSRGPQVRYDFLKDVQRLEDLDLPGYKVGFAILLTNSRSLWNAPAKNRKEPIVDPEFRLHEYDEDGNRRVISGCLEWADHSKQKCEGPRTHPLCLNGSYRPCWKKYYDLKFDKEPGLFKYLAFQVPSPES